MIFIEDEAIEVAREHVAWARKRGMMPAAILLSIYEPVPQQVNWDDAIMGVARQWRAIRQMRLAA